MEARWRGQLLLGGLGAIAVGNAFLLALSFYALLAALLHLGGSHAPSPVYAFLAGAVGATAILSLAFRRERQLREGAYGAWPRVEPQTVDPALEARLQQLSESAGLSGAPALRQVDSDLPNAFAVGRAREGASIVVTRGLLGLDPPERDAILAHELAHVESEDIRTVGLADAIAGTIGDLGREKARLFWGPRQIVADMVPFLIVFVVGLVLIDVLPAHPEGGSELGTLALSLGLAIGGIYWLWRLAQSALVSWRGLGQLFLLVTFFGPLTVVEWVLAPPTAIALSRLLSRTRVLEADRRAAELIGGPAALRSALRSLEPIEHSPGDEWQGALRFSLFVTPRAQNGYRAWLERITSTHPSVSERIEALADPELAQERSRGVDASRSRSDRLEQSG